MLDTATGTIIDDMPLFNAVEGERKAEEGIMRAAGKPDRSNLLKLARERAVHEALKWGEVNADQLVGYFCGLGVNLPKELGNAMGAIFRDRSVWEWTGKVVLSQRVSRHRNLIRVWTLK